MTYVWCCTLRPMQMTSDKNVIRLKARAEKRGTDIKTIRQRRDTLEFEHASYPPPHPARIAKSKSRPSKNNQTAEYLNKKSQNFTSATRADGVNEGKKNSWPAVEINNLNLFRRKFEWQVQYRKKYAYLRCERLWPRNWFFPIQVEIENFMKNLRILPWFWSWGDLHFLIFYLKTSCFSADFWTLKL